MNKLLYLLLISTLGACSHNESKSELAEYFYPQKAESTFYVYRDMANGFDEQIHRIYEIEDSEGKHIVVEIYTGEGRIIEAYNYNVDSLNLIDHMVVNAEGKKTKADILKDRLFPMNLTEESYFASRFPGIYDSTLILREVKRKASAQPKRQMEVLGKQTDVIVFDDYIRQTLFNPFKKTENVLDGKATTYYAKGYGMVAWHDKKKKHHFVLEQVLNEKEGIKLIGR
jgi:hypothetical protein